MILVQFVDVSIRKQISERRGQLKYDDTRAETRFRLSAQRTSPFKSAEVGVSSVDYWQPRCVRISGSNAGYTMFRGSVKCTGYPLHSPVFPFTSTSRASQCAYHISTGVYFWVLKFKIADVSGLEYMRFASHYPHVWKQNIDDLCHTETRPNW